MQHVQLSNLEESCGLTTNNNPAISGIHMETKQAGGTDTAGRHKAWGFIPAAEMWARSDPLTPVLLRYHRVIAPTIKAKVDNFTSSPIWAAAMNYIVQQLVLKRVLRVINAGGKSAREVDLELKKHCLYEHFKTGVLCGGWLVDKTLAAQLVTTILSTVDSFLGGGNLSVPLINHLCTYVSIGGFGDAIVVELMETNAVAGAKAVRLSGAAVGALLDCDVGPLIMADMVSPASVLALSEAASLALQDKGVKALLATQELLISQVLELSAVGSGVLRDSGVQGLIQSGIVSAVEVIALAAHHKGDALRNAGVQALLRDGTVTVGDLRSLGVGGRMAFGSPRICEYLESGEMSTMQALHLNVWAYWTLVSWGVYGLVKEKKICISDVLCIDDYYPHHALEQDNVIEWLRTGVLNIAQICAITTSDGYDVVTSQAMRAGLVEAEMFTPEHIAAITSFASYLALLDPSIQRHLRLGLLGLEHVGAIKNQATIKALGNEAVCQLIMSGQLTCEDISAIDPHYGVCGALHNPWVLQLIDDGRLTVTQLVTSPFLGVCALSAVSDLGWMIEASEMTVKRVLSSTRAAGRAFLTKGVLDLIDEGRLTIDDVLKVTDHAYRALTDPRVCELVSDGVLSADDIAKITTEATEAALRDVNNQQRLKNGRITIDALLGIDSLPNLTQGAEPAEEKRSARQTPSHSGGSQNISKHYQAGLFQGKKAFTTETSVSERPHPRNK